MAVLEDVLIISNGKKVNIAQITEQAVLELKKRGIRSTVIVPEYFRLDNQTLLSDIDHSFRYRNYSMIMAIGGDGTFLYTARNFLALDIPILGINAGRVGFLMEVSPDAVGDALEKILCGALEEKERILLEVEVKRSGKTVFRSPFLNDAVVSKGVLSRMVEMAVYLDNEALSQYRSDGLIVSTPTGSTAYNLAAGGPILTQDMEAMIITSICPHSLGVRPIVTGCTKELAIKFVSGESDTTLTIDGQENFCLKIEDYITINKCAKTIRLYDYGEKQFYGVLREKLGWHI